MSDTSDTSESMFCKGENQSKVTPNRLDLGVMVLGTIYADENEAIKDGDKAIKRDQKRETAMNMVDKFTLADEVMEDLLREYLVTSAEQVYVKLTYRSGAEQGEKGYLGYRPNSRRLFCFVDSRDHAVSFRRLSYKNGADYLECQINGQPHYLDYQAEGGAIYANNNRLWSVGWRVEDDALVVGSLDTVQLALCPDYEPVMMPILYASPRLMPFTVSVIAA